jgi:quercetin dioxygenase-like cupin family protein
MNLVQIENVTPTNEYGGMVFRINPNFGFFKLKPGERIRPGAHKHPEILYIAKGEVTFISTKDNEEVTAQAGNIVTIPAHQEKAIVNNGKEEVSAFWVNAVSL